MRPTAEEVIAALNLAPHPEEGGFFRETYRSAENFRPGGPFTGERSHSTGIYYLLTADTFSAMHRLPGDEMFHFYAGDPVAMLELFPSGESRHTILGPDLQTMTYQRVVPGGVWQGSRLVEGGEWALLGTTMAPGFSFEDYEHGSAALLDEYPSERTAIEARLRR